MAKQRLPYSQKYAERVLKALDNLEKVEKECNEKYPKYLAEELDEVGKEVIAKWYAGYEPIYYDRKRNLYNAYKIDLKGSVVSVTADASYLASANYHQGEGVVYANVFERGYHGGSLGEDGPQRIIPYWRTYPGYKYWSRPAMKSKSPLSELTKYMSNRAQEIMDERNGKIEKAMERVLRNTEAFIRKGRS